MTVDSSSSMFQIVSCTLTVKDDAMTAKMTMGGNRLPQGVSGDRRGSGRCGRG